MIHKVDPTQPVLFDELVYRLDRTGMLKGMLADWPGLFRTAILETMPVGVIEKEFDPETGRPTKELFSVSGLILLAEAFDWTARQAVAAYRMHLDVHFALNLSLDPVKFSESTFYRYKRLCVEDDVAARAMARVTARLVDILDLKITKQRLDSTHVFSNMARIGRTRLMGMASKRFLVQVKRHARPAYDALPERIREIYETPPGRLFGGGGKKPKVTMQQAAEDLLWLIEYFARDEAVTGRNTYKLMKTVFEQQCEIAGGGKVRVREKTGNDVIQNTSDPDATREGPKGPGYKVQLAETHHEENETQLITSAIPQTGAEDDRDAMPLLLADREAHGLLPEQDIGDTHYGSDAGHQLCASKGVELVAPAPTPPHVRDIHATNAADFEVDDETHTVVRCPEGHEPASSQHDPKTGKTRTVMPAEKCKACPRTDCPVQPTKRGVYRMYHTPSQRRLQQRRRHEETDEFRQTYARRAGIESTNSGLKRCTGLGQLRVRGSPNVRHSLLMKVCGWNILRAAGTEAAYRYVLDRAQQLWGYVIPHVVRAVAGSVHRLAGLLRPPGGFVTAFTGEFRLRTG